MSANGISGPHGRDITAAEAGSTTPSRNGPIDSVTFDDVLEAINPLQYLPVVGTIYRVCTGDQGIGGLRTAVSLLTGALTGGPVGLLTSIGGELIERMFHVEDLARSALHGTATAGSPPHPPAPPPLTPVLVAAAAAAYGRGDALGERLAWGGRER